MIAPAHHQMFQWSNKEDVNRGIATIWQDNAIKNIAYFDAHPEKVIGSIHDIPKYEGKAVIYAGRGQSLQKAIDMFKDADDRFIVVCSNSSLRYLLDHGVIPHYMILIDGEKGAWTFDNLPKDAEQVTAIFAAGAYHDEVVKWPGKIMVVPYGVKKGSVQKEIRKRWGKSIAAGGNALNGAVAIFLMNTLVKIHAFVGLNFSFKEGQYFYFNQETDRDDKAYFIMHDIYGEECYTDMPMYQYKVWLEQAASQFYPDCYFVNCSEGILGVDVDGKTMPIFDHMPLDMAIERIKDALDFEQQDEMSRCREFYQRLYDSGGYTPNNGEDGWKSIFEHVEKNIIPPFKTALDVGCGLGKGLAFARAQGIDAYGVDISDNRKIWEENGVADYCQQAPAHKIPYADNRFDLVFCGDVLEHIPEEYLMPTLREMYRVGSNAFIFVIAVKLEVVPPHEAVYTHLSVKPSGKWVEMMTEIGYHVYSAKDDETGHCIIQAVKHA